MRKLFAILLAGILLLSCAAAEADFVPNAVEDATNTGYPSALALTDDYTARYGTWWTWTPDIFDAYSLELRRIPELTGRTARAMAETSYVLPPANALTQEEMAALAIAAAGAPYLSYVNTLYFLVQTEGDARYVSKVILSDGTNYSHAVELDPFTGEVLCMQTRLPLVGAGQFLTPAAVWDATPELAPNG